MKNSFTGLDILCRSDLNKVLILTPNLRLQRELVKAYNQIKQAENQKSWLTPNIHSLSSWITEIWEELQDQGLQGSSNLILADQNQIASLWFEVITNDSDDLNVLNIQSLLAPAMSAFKTLQLWEIDNIDALGMESIESATYLRWHNKMTTELKKRDWVTAEHCIEIISQAIVTGDIALDKEVVLFSFDETPPIYRSLFKSIKCSGVTLNTSETPECVSDQIKVAAKDNNDQYMMVAQWAKKIFEQDIDNRICIVCPDLTKHKSSIESTLTQVFEPQAILPHIPRYTLPFNFSAGTPLGDIPLIRDALTLLGLGNRQAPSDSMLSLLHSPYIAGAEKELSLRAKFDLTLRTMNAGSFSLRTMASHQSCPAIFKKSISEFLGCVAISQDNQRPSEWAIHFSESLTALGWPGDRNLDSEEFQALSHWHSQLDQLSKLDSLFQECNQQKAISLLKQCVKRTVFHPETTDSPLQVLGILEASGLSFDYTWIMDLNDDVWPPAPAPNPFIPLPAQKRLNMPHASSERELDFSQRILQRLRSSSNNIVMSYVERDGDKELRSSPLIDDTPLTGRESPSLDYQHQCTSYESIICDANIPLSPIIDPQNPIRDLTAVRGGAGIISSQANCPFQAYSKYRLKASEIPKLSMGLSHIERGDIVHHVMEFIWLELKCQENLLALDDTEQNNLINKAIDFAFFWLKKNRVTGDRLLKVERKRLLIVINQWLSVERKRSPFIVDECERNISTTIAGVPIRIKRDRVDLINGRRFHLDYKTGKPNIAGWSGDRLTDPQVPLYVITDDSEIPCVGAAFGQIRKGESALKGIYDDTDENSYIAAGIIPSTSAPGDLPSSWDEIKKHWLQSIEVLAGEFSSGVTDIAPLTPSVCSLCDFPTLCRK